MRRMLLRMKLCRNQRKRSKDRDRSKERTSNYEEYRKRPLSRNHKKNLRVRIKKKEEIDKKSGILLC